VTKSRDFFAVGRLPLRHNARVEFPRKPGAAAFARRDGARRSGRPEPSPRPCWRSQRSGAGRRPWADAMSGWDRVEPPGKHARGAVLFHALDGRRGIVAPMRAARPVASRRITALGLKRFIAGLSCDALASAGKSGRTTRFYVECPAGEVFVVVGARRGSRVVLRSWPDRRLWWRGLLGRAGSAFQI